MKEDFSVSGMRSMVHEAHNKPFEPIQSFEQAVRTEGAVLIMEGDCGGQIYLTCPMRYIRANPETLRELLLWLDSLQWNDPEGASIHCEVIPAGQGVAGGMGGGAVVDGLWLHPRLEEQGVRTRVEAMLADKNL